MPLAPWEEENVEDLDPITRSSGIPLTVSDTSRCILKFFDCKGTGRRTEHLQVCVGNSAIAKDTKQGMFRWM